MKPGSQISFQLFKIHRSRPKKEKKKALSTNLSLKNVSADVYRFHDVFVVLFDKVTTSPLFNLRTETLGGGDYLFAFRMLMVLFRREFSFGDSLYLWEVICPCHAHFPFSINLKHRIL